MTDAPRGQVRKGSNGQMVVSQETAGKRALSGVGGKVEEAQCRGVRERQRVSMASKENAKWDPRHLDDSRNLA